MKIVDHGSQPVEEWREGVTTRMRVSALTATTELCVFEQWCTPGHGAPTHTHTVEEILAVLAGQAEVWLGEERATMTAGQSLVVPAGIKHGFRNTGSDILHVQATLAAPIFEAVFDSKTELTRRWVAGA